MVASLAVISAHMGLLRLLLLLQPAIAPDGSLWVFGGNGNGQLGTGTRASQMSPTLQSSVGSRAVSVAPGERALLTVSQDGAVWGMGDNRYYILGVGHRSDSKSLNLETSPLRSLKTLGVGSAFVTRVSVGNRHGWALRSDGQVWAWGYNSNGQLGNGVLDATLSSPVRQPVRVATDVSAIAVGPRHSLYHKRDGTLWACGANDNGQLGMDLGSGLLTTPTKIEDVGVLTREMSTSSEHTLLLLTNGSVVGFGLNDHGQLGVGDTASRFSPTIVRFADGQTEAVVAISAGFRHSLLATASGRLYACGRNKKGELGSTKATTPLLFTRVEGIADKVVQVAAGGRQEGGHSIALTEKSAVWSFGWNANGQLGLGDRADRSNPQEIGGTATRYPSGSVEETAAIYAGSDYSVIRKDRCSKGEFRISKQNRTTVVCISCPVAERCDEPARGPAMTCKAGNGVGCGCREGEYRISAPDAKRIDCIKCPNASRCTGYDCRSGFGMGCGCKDGEYRISHPDSTKLECIKCPVPGRCSGYSCTTGAGVGCGCRAGEFRISDFGLTPKNLTCIGCPHAARCSGYSCISGEGVACGCEAGKFLREKAGRSGVMCQACKYPARCTGRGALSAPMRAASPWRRGGCLPGSEGIGCKWCDTDGYYLHQDVCVPCPSNTRNLIALLAAVTLVVLPTLAWQLAFFATEHGPLKLYGRIPLDREVSTALSGVLLNHLQLSLIIWHFDFSWPTTMHEFGRIGYAVACFDFGAIAHVSRCAYTAKDETEVAWWRLLISFGALLFTTVLWFSVYRSFGMKQRVSKRKRYRAINAVHATNSILFVGLFGSALRCVLPHSDQPLLGEVIAYRSDTCKDLAHWGLLRACDIFQSVALSLGSSDVKWQPSVQLNGTYSAIRTYGTATGQAVGGAKAKYTSNVFLSSDDVLPIENYSYPIRHETASRGYALELPLHTDGILSQSSSKIAVGDLRSLCFFVGLAALLGVAVLLPRYWLKLLLRGSNQVANWNGTAILVGRPMWVDQSYKAKYGWLFMRYRPMRWWWEFVVLGRKASLVALAMMLEKAPLSFAVATLAICLASIMMQALFKPYTTGQDELTDREVRQPFRPGDLDPEKDGKQRYRFDLDGVACSVSIESHSRKPWELSQESGNMECALRVAEPSAFSDASGPVDAVEMASLLSLVVQTSMGLASTAPQGEASSVPGNLPLIVCAAATAAPLVLAALILARGIKKRQVFRDEATGRVLPVGKVSSEVTLMGSKDCEAESRARPMAPAGRRRGAVAGGEFDPALMLAAEAETKKPSKKREDAEPRKGKSGKDKGSTGSKGASKEEGTKKKKKSSSKEKPKKPRKDKAKGDASPVKTSEAEPLNEEPEPVRRAPQPKPRTRRSRSVVSSSDGGAAMRAASEAPALSALPSLAEDPTAKAPIPRSRRSRSVVAGMSNGAAARAAKEAAGMSMQRMQRIASEDAEDA